MTQSGAHRYSLRSRNDVNELVSIATELIDESTEHHTSLARVASIGDVLADAALSEVDICQQLDDLPLSHDDAMQRSDSENWKKAEIAEIQSMIKSHVFKTTTPPPGRKPVQSKWVYRIKRDKFGNVDRYKARIVAKGFKQVLGIDYDEVFSPVVRLTTLRLIYALTIELRLILHQMDVDTAFLNADLKEEIYLQPPPGMELPPGQAYKLLKSLYGLKQAPREWNACLNEKLISLGFNRLVSDICIYYKGHPSTNDFVILSVYVDDLAIAASTIELVTHTKKQLTNQFKMKDMGPISFMLGMSVVHSTEHSLLTVSQSQYIHDTLQRFHLNLYSPISTPMNEKLKLTKEMAPKNISEIDFMKDKPVRQAIGCLLWLSMGTRPDISCAVCHVAKFANNPGPQHWHAIVRIFRYLMHTINLGLIYTPTSSTPNLLPIGYMSKEQQLVEKFFEKKVAHAQRRIADRAGAFRRRRTHPPAHLGVAAAGGVPRHPEDPPGPPGRRVPRHVVALHLSRTGAGEVHLRGRRDTDPRDGVRNGHGQEAVGYRSRGAMKSRHSCAQVSICARRSIS